MRDKRGLNGLTIKRKFGLKLYSETKNVDNQLLSNESNRYGSGFKYQNQHLTITTNK